MRWQLILLVAVVAIGPAVAAQTPNPRPPTPRYNTSSAYGGSAADFQNRLTNDVLERQRNGGQNEERLTLIERLAPLVAEGRCNEARRIARAEGDRPVSRRIGEVCVEGRPTPMPEAPAT